MLPDDPRHGTIAGYHQHARFGPPVPDDDACGCRTARARYENQRRLKEMQGQPRIVPTLGLRRRVEALRWSGWTLDRIALEAGWKHGQSVDNVLIRDTCNAVSAERIICAYNVLSRRTPPPGQGTNLARSLARRNGYAPAAAWDSWDDASEKPKGVRHAA